MKVVLRWNVLILIGAGYASLIIIFGAMSWGGLTAEEAYEVVKSPLMALIGGSLAISKDLIPLGDSRLGSEETVENQTNIDDNRRED